MIATTDILPKPGAVPKFMGKVGRRGMPKAFAKKLYADYLRLGSVAKVALEHDRTRQSIWDTLTRHGYKLNARKIEKEDVVMRNGVKYTPTRANGGWRATTHQRIAGEKYLHRIAWIELHGPIPAGAEVICINGNKRDVRPENLKLMPRAAVSKMGKRAGNNGATVKRREELIAKHHGFICQQALKWSRWYGVDPDVLIQAGRIAIVEADERFDHSRGVKFLSYASWWIKKCMRNCVYENKDTIRIPHNLRGKHFVPVVSLDASVSSDEEGQTLMDVLEVPESTTGEVLMDERADLLRRAMKRMPKNYQVVIRGRFFQDKTLEEIGGVLGVTREAIRQMEMRALKVLKRSILARRCVS